LLGTRTGSAHLAAAERAGVVFPPWGPTRFDGPHVKHVRATVDDIAQRLGATAHQVAQAWHLHRSPNALPIPRTRTIRHFDANIGAARIGLSAEEVGRLTDLTPENNGETDS
jgi:aryl-alcohol dehydrogenase-like predicted oxidoreductase